MAAKTTVWNGKVHEFADSFPLMTDSELEELAASIKAHGLRHPITLDRDGTLIDGRNRLRACEMAGVVPTFTQMPDGADPEDFILDENVEHRFLKQGQKALQRARAVVAKWQRITGKPWDWTDYRTLTQADKEAIPQNVEPLPNVKLAALMGIPSQRVDEAMLVLRYAPDNVDGVLAGSVTFATAIKQAQAAKRRAEAAGRAEERAKEIAAAEQADLATAKERLAALAERHPAIFEQVQADEVSLREGETIAEAQEAHARQEAEDAQAHAEGRLTAAEQKQKDDDDRERAERTSKHVYNGLVFLANNPDVETPEERVDYLMRVVKPAVGPVTYTDLDYAAQVLRVWAERVRAGSPVSRHGAEGVAAVHH